MNGIKRIVFNDEDAKQMFIDDNCPEDIDERYESYCDVAKCDGYDSCKKCWEGTGIYLVVDA